MRCNRNARGSRCAPLSGLFPAILELKGRSGRLERSAGDDPAQVGAGEQVQNRSSSRFWRRNDARLASDPREFGRGFQRDFVSAQLIDESLFKRLFTGENAAVRKLLDAFSRQLFTPVGNRVDELIQHLIDQFLQVFPLFWRDLPRRISNVLELTALYDLGFELGPFEQVPVVDPFGDDAYRTGDSPRICNDLIGS